MPASNNIKAATPGSKPEVLVLKYLNFYLNLWRYFNN
jgi:hypothetical protein